MNITSCAEVCVSSRHILLPRRLETVFQLVTPQTVEKRAFYRWYLVGAEEELGAVTMTLREFLLEKVTEIVSRQLSVPIEEISEQSTISDDLKADSLDAVELVMEFEDEFDMTVPDEHYGHFGGMHDGDEGGPGTITTIVDYIVEHGGDYNVPAEVLRG